MLKFKKRTRQDERKNMVSQQLARRGIKDTYVLESMAVVERERFMPKEIDKFAYEDRALHIGFGQTISQPYVVAMMAELAELHPTDKVLEIGTGSGYGAAVLSLIVSHVYTVERHPTLALRAENILANLEYDNVTVIEGDGSKGLSEAAPFDAIVVTAGAPAIADILKRQLEIGGRLVIPVGEEDREQKLLQIKRTGHDSYEMQDYGSVRFVPLIGEFGWHSSLPQESNDIAE